MNCGASMGEVWTNLNFKEEMSVEEANRSVIAVPGKSTSSYLALVLALGEVEVVEVPFDQILRVLDGKYDSG